LDFLKESNIVTISDVDTRALVSYIRDNGSMNAVITTEDINKTEELKKRLKSVPSMNGLELASKVSTKESYFYGDENSQYKVAVIDLGIKMNIFNDYLEKIKETILNLSQKGKLILPDQLDGITAEIPPSKFNSDISTNVAMVLSKINKKTPADLAQILSEALKENDKLIENISIVKPGFINISFKPIFWTNFISEILKNSQTFGINTKEKKNNYLIEFVSANPTGPLHVGHCRGAILGDVIANILLFNKHKVTKEYYVNDYGNQILNFTKSVYFRIREIKLNEPFPIDNEDLYPGDYLIDFAKNILVSYKDIDLKNFDKISEKLTILSIEEALKLIKQKDQ